MNLKKKLLFFFVLFLTIITSFYYYINNLKNGIVVNEDTYYLLVKNTSHKKILSQLKYKNIDISSLSWKLVSLFHETPFVPKAGEYNFPKNITLFEIQKTLQKGLTLTRNFTLVEGITAVELKKQILNNPFLSGDVDNLKEGIYKPDTYFFKRGYPRKKLLEQMKRAQDKALEEVWKTKPVDFTLKNKNQFLILASIIQKESSNADDSKLVASVFINRLETKMKLQSDVTLAYGFKVNGNKITKKMLRSDNLYNTYKYFGLPPTPISYPGKDALNSLKNLKRTDYFYFVSDGRGRHRFSKTYSLHKKNIKLWKNNLIKDK